MGLNNSTNAETEKNVDATITEKTVVEPISSISDFIPPKLVGDAGLLSEHDLKTICQQMPPTCTKEWIKIFCSSVDGKSFSRFGTKVCNKGPTIVVIKDSDGHVFGGFADESWRSSADRIRENIAEAAAVSRAQKCGQHFEVRPRPAKQSRMFFGGTRCFLFSILPECHVYLSSGLNGNFMYYEENTEVKEYTGVGMGGQKEFFGWFLDGWLDHGHSRGSPNCLTFKSPRLSKEEDFLVDIVEVWQVSESVEDGTNSEASTGNLMGKAQFAADMLILELNDKKFYSK